MRRESDFDRKGCAIAAWMIVAFVVLTVIGLLMEGRWVLAIIIPLSLPLLILPHALIYWWLTSDKQEESKSNYKDDVPCEQTKIEATKQPQV